MTTSLSPAGLLLLGLWLWSPLSSSHAQTGQPEQDDDSELPQVLTLSREDVGPYRPEHTPDLEEVRQLIVKKTNAFRRSEDRTDLQRNKHLDAAAQQFAAYMAQTERYGHRADGRDPGDRAGRQEYKYCLIAENIAYHFATESFPTGKLAEQATQGWIDSPGHRRNMLRPHVTEIGTGVAQSETTGIFYAVQLFGRPESAEIAFEVANDAGQSVTYTVGDQSFDLPDGTRRRHRMCVPQSLQLATAGEEESAGRGPAITPEAEARYHVSIVDGQPTLRKSQ